MKQAFVLVDYDNQREGRFRNLRPGGARLNVRDHEDFLDGLLKKLVDYREKELGNTKEVLELRVRLYGGWTNLGGETTTLADMVLKAVRLQALSRRVRSTRIFVDLGDRPLSTTSEALLGTLRPIPWRGSLDAVADHPIGCTSASALCFQIQSAVAWSRGRCPLYPSCSVSRDDAFSYEGQKMVDTMMVADALYAHADGAFDVVICSADDDVVPGVLTLAALKGRATLMRFGMRKKGRFDHLMERSAVRIVDYPALG